MTAYDAYDKFLLKVEKNGVNDYVATDKGRFVELINSSYLKYISYTLEKKNQDDIRELAPLLVTSPTIKGKKHGNYFEFDLPENLFEFSSLDATAKKGSCSDTLEIVYEIKDQNKQFYLSDEFTKPSFEYRESLFNLTDNKIRIYTDSTFKITSLKINYYRYPNFIRLIDPKDPESDFDPTINLELGKETIDRIISVAAGEFDLRTDNPRGQLSIQRAITKI